MPYSGTPEEKREKRKSYMRRWRESQRLKDECSYKEKVRERKRKYVENNRERVNSTKREYYRNNCKKNRETKICSIPECGKKHYGNGLCGMHWARVRRNGHPELIRRNNGTGSINKDGYIDVCVNRRRTYEHILIAEKVLGRPLPPKAIVHHMNGNKSDNRTCNLAILPNESYHKLIHRRMKLMDIL